MDDLLLSRLRAAVGDRYDVERRLGEGGMATVYLAFDRKTPRNVAIKVLKPHLADGVGVERFKQEIAIAANCFHPHIVPLLESDRAADGLLYYTMPFVAGDTLRPRLDGRPLPIDDAVRIACDVADALVYAHSQGIVHRDIKPENIMFAGAHAVVTDFGIARAITAARDTPSREPIGTPAYMSPEQAEKRPVDGRSDIFSLGCVLYEMLTGTTPFPGAMLLVGEPPPPLRAARRDVTEVLERIVLRALAHDPVNRFATAADFQDALSAKMPPPAGAALQSIAVLPFSNLTQDRALIYLSDGIAEQITMSLARVPGLRVAACTSSFSFRAKDLDLREIGTKLGVATVLEGSVSTSPSALHVSARLCKVADGLVAWSGSYDGRMADAVAIPDQIAGSIAAELKLALKDWEGRLHPGPPATPPTRNADAYDLYLQGRHELAERGPGLRRALQAFDQAVALDPNYAVAHAGLAETCAVLAQYGLVSPNAIRSKAQEAARRALELAPHLAEAHCAAGVLSMVCDWDWAGASASLQRAVELNPRYVQARIWIAFYLVFVEGRFDAGIDQAQRAVELDPLAPLPAMQLGMTLFGAGRYGEAEAPLRRVAELAPTMFTPPHLGLLYHRLGRTREAVAVLEGAIATSGRHPWTLCAMAVCQRSLGDVGRVEAIHHELVARARYEYVQASMLAIVNAALGRMDEAFALMSRACDEHEGIIYLSKRYPFLDVLQADPRMEEVFRRVNFP